MEAEPQTAPKRILVIDDNKMAMHLMTSLLGAIGCIPISAASGLQGVQEISRSLEAHELVDLVITDVQLPDIDGPEVVDRIRALGYRGPIVVFTAMPSAHDMKELKIAGVNAYFSKMTLNKKLLSAIVSEYCHS